MTSTQFLGCQDISPAGSQGDWRWRADITLQGGQNWKLLYYRMSGNVLHMENMTTGNGVTIYYLDVVDKKQVDHRLMFHSDLIISVIFNKYC